MDIALLLEIVTAVPAVVLMCRNFDTASTFNQGAMLAGVLAFILLDVVYIHPGSDSNEHEYTRSDR